MKKGNEDTSTILQKKDVRLFHIFWILDSCQLYNLGKKGKEEYMTGTVCALQSLKYLLCCPLQKRLADFWFKYSLPSFQEPRREYVRPSAHLSVQSNSHALTRERFTHSSTLSSIYALIHIRPPFIRWSEVHPSRQPPILPSSHLSNSSSLHPPINPSSFTSPSIHLPFHPPSNPTSEPSSIWLILLDGTSQDFYNGISTEMGLGAPKRNKAQNL